MLREGAILLLDLDGKLTPGLAIAIEQNSLRALTPEGEKKLKFERVVRASAFRASSTGQAGLNEAASHVNRVRELADTADLAALWDLAVEMDLEMPLEDLADLCFGDVGALGVDAMAVALLRDRVYFKARKTGFAPNPARTVEAVKAQLAAEQAQQRDEDEAVHWLLVASRDPQLALNPDAAGARVLALLRDHALYGQDCPRAPKAMQLLARARPGHPDPTPLQALDWLVRLGVFAEDENLDVYRHRLRTVFSSQALVEAEYLAAEGLRARIDAALAAGRRDARGEATLAIDDATTKDVDDALAAVALGDGRILVHVLIADPDELIAQGSALDTEARNRAASLYLPDRIVPMLPEVISEGVLSLTPNEDRFGLWFSFEVDAQGDCSAIRIDEVVCRLSERLTYDEVDQRLAAGEEASVSLSLLAEAARRLRERRLAAGALPLQQSEAKVRVRDGEIDVKILPPGSAAREMVAEFMVATGHLTALLCAQNHIPAVYRWQEEPEQRLEFDLARAADPVYIYESLVRMRRAEISSEPRPHFGLGVPAYTQITSPIRRYQDLAMHHQIKGWLRTGTPPLGPRELLDVFAEVEGISSLFGRMERDAKRYWILKWLASRAADGVELRAVALRPLGNRWLVHLPELAMNDTVVMHRAVKAGDELLVRVRGAKPRRDRLDLQAI